MLFRAAQDSEAGVLRPGDRLPPQRGLANGLGVKLSTISRAYREAAQRRLDLECGLEFTRGARIVPAGLGADGPLVGAAAVWHHARRLTGLAVGA